MPRRIQHEAREATALWRWWQFSHKGLGCPSEKLMIHVKNEDRSGKDLRAKIAAANAKRRGLVSGVSDYLLFVGRGGYHGMALELKAADRGRVSPLQAEWQALLREQGYYCVVAHGAINAMAEITRYLLGKEVRT